jgi:hypothetical protein
MPKKITKNCGWARKLLRQQMKVAARVTATAATRWPRADTRTRDGRVPSANSRTAQR